MPRLLLLLTIFFIVACDAEVEVETSVTAEQKAVTAETKDATISWYGDSIEQAFALAESEDQPLFLYWGAVWCPPCQEIKHTVFKSQDFINLSRAFIPVYLDGDTDLAQAWGEKFGVQGYPTMIVFNPAGEEVTRIPGGIDISRYNTVLELSLNQMRPTSMLVELALNNPAELSDDDYYQLAYYSWGQDSAAVPEDTDEALMFFELADGAPGPELKSRFYMMYLIEMAQQNEPGENGETPELTVRAGDDVYARLSKILESDELTLGVWDAIAYYPDDILELPVYEDEQKAVLQNLWTEQVFSLRFDASLSKAEKLAGWLPKVYFETLDDQTLDEESQLMLRKEMQAVDALTPDSYERQSVINQMSYVYRQAGMKDDAKNLLLAELEKSSSAYYFMSSLSGMAENNKDFTEAIEWRRKAHDTSTGEATRFQWGAGYVAALIRMSPEDSEIITDASTGLLDEFHASNEMFAGRNFRVLRRLNERLAKWQETRGIFDLAFSSKIETLCEDQTAGSIEETNCLSLFVTEDVVAQSS